MEATQQEGFELNDKAKATITGFTEHLIKAAEAARSDAFSELNRYLTDYAFEDFRENTLEAARRIVADVLSGKSHLAKGWAENLTNEAEAIRDYLWKNYADEIVKAQLEEKDRTIERLKGFLQAGNFHY